jgi:hypothetical protein
VKDHADDFSRGVFLERDLCIHHLEKELGGRLGEYLKPGLAGRLREER